MADSVEAYEWFLELLGKFDNVDKLHIYCWETRDLGLLTTLKSHWKKSL
jgi:hypothetical protein